MTQTIESTVAKPRKRLYRRDVDGVRAIAILLVIGFHAFPSKVTGGFVGVDVFFVISGYLITGGILRELQTGTFTFLNFYAKRCRRIIPALAVVLLGTLAIGAYCLLAPEMQNLGQQTWAGSVFVTNILLWKQTGYFDAAGESKPLLHLWSLGIEEQFYLLWPLLLSIAVRRRFNTLLILGLMTTASFLLNVAGVVHHQTATFYWLPTRFWELLLGGILAHIETNERSFGHRATAFLLSDQTPARVQHAKSWVGFALVVISALSLRNGSAFPGWWAVAPVTGAVLLISAGRDAWVNRVVLSSAPAVFLGLISYPLYLWHWPLLSIAGIIEQDIPARSTRIACVVLATILAWLTWRLVERSAQHRWFAFGASRRKMAECVALCCASLLCIAAIGWTTEYEQGFPEQFARRFPTRYKELQDLTEMPNPGAIFPKCSGALQAGSSLTWCNTARVGAPDIALYGDSHALYMFPGFAQVFSSRGLNALAIGESSCAPLQGVQSFLKGTKEQCSGANSLALALLVSSPSIHTVVLSSLGPYYFSGVSFASDHMGFADASNWILAPVDGSLRSSKSALFEAGWSAAISVLESAGKRVVIFIDVPELNFHPSACIDARPVRIGEWHARNPCGVSAAVVRARQEEYRRIVADLKGSHPQLLVFDPLPYLCDGDLCSAEHAGRLVYRDSNHLSVYGSQYLSAQLDAWLQGPLTVTPRPLGRDETRQPSAPLRK